MFVGSGHQCEKREEGASEWKGGRKRDKKKRPGGHISEYHRCVDDAHFIAFHWPPPIFAGLKGKILPPPHHHPHE